MLLFLFLYCWISFLFIAFLKGRNGFILYAEAYVSHELELVKKERKVVDLLESLGGSFEPQLL